MIGTEKGLFLARSDDDRKSWQLSGPHHAMNAVYAVAATRDRLYASVTSSHFGPSVVTSDDLGATWQEPDHAPIAFPEDTGVALERVWQLVPGPRLWAGVQPSALFVSDDGGATFELVR